MMREIKFRAWDKETKRMMRVTRLDYPEWIVCVGEDKPKTVEEYYICERNSFKNEETDRFILMQYTGLKDKNGKWEAYQSDIIKGLHKTTSEEIVGEIVWDEKSYNWGIQQDSWIMGFECLMNCFDIEVIGNIHSNPELIEAVGSTRQE